MIHPNSPDNPERIAEYQARYAALLSENHPEASVQLRAAFLKSMEGKEYGHGPLLNAFGWFWEGWAKSSGSRTTPPEALRRGETPRTDEAAQGLPIYGPPDSEWVDAELCRQLEHEISEAIGYLTRNVLEPHKAQPLPTLIGICTQVDHLCASVPSPLARSQEKT